MKLDGTIMTVVSSSHRKNGGPLSNKKKFVEKRNIQRAHNTREKNSQIKLVKLVPMLVPFTCD